MQQKKHISTISVRQLFALTETLSEKIQEEKNVSSSKNYLC